jgi:UDP-3-O-[3-hydroxymyristoyl] glucosamine N-acyltransferase
MAENSITLKQLADFLQVELQGEGDCAITRIAPLNKAQKGEISFLESKEYCKYLNTTEASAIILTQEFSKLVPNKNLLITKNPYLAYAKISSLFDNSPKPVLGIHDTVIIGKNCEIDSTVSIGPRCVIGNNVKIGKNVELGPLCVLGDDVGIGDHSKLYANVNVYYKVAIGQRVIIHSGVIIGSDGFGMVNDKGVWHKIHQLGGVVIGDDVEIGANTVIDRGALDNTIIENGVKLDNLIQVAHNVFIGAHTAIAGCVGIAGSAKIGKHCMIGGGAGINGHIEIADGTIITARCAIHKSITESGGIYAGAIPGMPHKTWWRILHRILKLDELFQRVSKLEKKENE